MLRILGLKVDAYSTQYDTIRSFHLAACDVADLNVTSWHEPDKRGETPLLGGPQWHQSLLQMNLHTLTISRYSVCFYGIIVTDKLTYLDQLSWRTAL